MPAPRRHRTPPQSTPPLWDDFTLAMWRGDYAELFEPGLRDAARIIAVPNCNRAGCRRARSCQREDCAAELPARQQKALDRIRLELQLMDAIHDEGVQRDFARLAGPKKKKTGEKRSAFRR